MCCFSLSVFAQANLEGLFSWCPPSPSASFSVGFLEGFDGDITLRAEYPKVSHFLHIVWLGESLYVFPSAAGGSFSGDG